MNLRTLALLLALSCGSLAAAPRDVAHASGSDDARILSAASLRQWHEAPPLVVQWLRRQPLVEAASVGRDGATVDVYFRDGMHAAILSKSLRWSAMPPLSRLTRLAAPAESPASPRAAVWEPFASELGLGPNAGDVEVQQLQATGFAVDQKYDTNVTVAAMTSLAQYNVVYMHTHSGVSAAGDGVVATGEPANGDPAVASYLADGSVITVGVAGSSQQYYAITSKFVSLHVGAFAAGSLLFLNGCALLRATTFWQTLHARGAGVLVSWDQNAAARDDFLSAAAFFNVMGAGKSVSDAISVLRASGYGTSSDNGVPAALGFVGDGSITLPGAAAGGAANPTPSPVTSTPLPPATVSVTQTPVPVTTATRTATPMPAATATSTPIPTHPPVPALVSLTHLVKPGTMQHIVVANLLPNTSVQVRITFPDGEVAGSRVNADAAGNAQFSFIQLGSKLTRHSRTTVVQVTATTASGTVTTTLNYVIGYAKVDIVANPRTLPAGGQGTVLVHTQANMLVVVSLQRPTAKVTNLQGVTGRLGWIKLRYAPKPPLKHGETLVLRATVRLPGKTVHAAATVRGK